MSGTTEVSKSTMHDMTVGKPSKLIIQFMIPMFLGNVFQQFYNVADSIVAGQFLGVQALAAIGSTGSLMFFVTGWMNGMSSGFAILVSQWFGAKKYDRMRHYVAMSVYLSIILSVLMTVGFLAANEPILRMMNYSPDIMPDVTAYMGIIYAGLIVTAAYNALAAFLRALGDSRSPLYFLIISAAINVVLDIVFIVYGGMGVDGCAYATVIAQAISALLCFIYIVKRYPILHLKREDFRISFRSWGRLLALGIPMALQFSITAIGTIIVQGAVNVYGEIYMAGFSAAGKLQNIIATVFSAFGATIATYVGQNRGAGKMDRVRQGVRTTQMMIIVYSVFAMAVVLLLGRYMMWIFVSPSETEVIDVAVLYFRTVFWCYPFLGSIFLYRNTLQGLGYGLVPMLGGVFELVARAGIVLLVAGRTSFVGVCLSDPAAWLSALIPLVPYYIYIMKKWKKV
ncbi:MAG: MATE family efflux transporter [Blautia sp.]